MLTHHFIFKGAFKFKTSVTGSPVVYHHNHITEGGQGVQAEILDSFKSIVHQLYLEKKHIFSELCGSTQNMRWKDTANVRKLNVLTIILSLKC